MPYSPSERAKRALFEIRDNCLLALEFASAKSAEELRANRMAFYATTRALEIVSEAARRLPAELRARRSDMPWDLIMNAGNVYRHGYDVVDEETILRTALDSVPPLLKAIEEEITLLVQP